MSCYLVQEIDGVGRFELEDGSGFLVLEACVPVPPTPGMGGEPRKGRRRRLEQIAEEEMLASVLAEL